jgi:hypothetical protein
LEYLGTERIILKKTWHGMMWNLLVWVRIRTCGGLKDPWFKSWYGGKIFLSSRPSLTGYGLHFYSMGTGVLSWGKAAGA